MKHGTAPTTAGLLNNWTRGKRAGCEQFQLAMSNWKWPLGSPGELGDTAAFREGDACIWQEPIPRRPTEPETEISSSSGILAGEAHMVHDPISPAVTLLTAKSSFPSLKLMEEAKPTRSWTRGAPQAQSLHWEGLHPSHGSSSLQNPWLRSQKE